MAVYIVKNRFVYNGTIREVGASVDVDDQDIPRLRLANVLVDLPPESTDSAVIGDGSIGTSKFAADAKAPLAGTADAAPWAGVTGKPTVIAAGADQAAARAAIGAGTSNLALGTTSTTAKAGDYTPPNAGAAVRGLVLQAATQANSAATDVAGLVTDFNALLAKLKAAGSMA